MVAEDLRGLWLQGRGAQVIGPAPRLGRARSLIACGTDRWVDIHLAGELVFPAAEALDERRGRSCSCPGVRPVVRSGAFRPRPQLIRSRSSFDALLQAMTVLLGGWRPGNPPRAVGTGVHMSTILDGRCLCGAVRYKVTGPALDSGSCRTGQEAGACVPPNPCMPMLSMDGTRRQRPSYRTCAVASGTRPPRRSLDRDRRCDVLVVGAGITGALVAERLVREGRDVCIVDRESGRD